MNNQSKILKGKHHLRDLVVDGRIMLIRILHKQMRAWTLIIFYCPVLTRHTNYSNIQSVLILPIEYIYIPCGLISSLRLVSYTALTSWSLCNVFPARYELHFYIFNIEEVSTFKPSVRGYNWATLFLGDINTGTWPSRLGESQRRQ
jgi:hypothetical protein